MLYLEEKQAANIAFWTEKKVLYQERFLEFIPKLKRKSF